jgi:hypothetical protein
MSEQSSERGAAEEGSGVPHTDEDHNEPASPSSTPGDGDSFADGYAEEATDTD